MAGNKDAYNQAMKEGRAQAWGMNWPAAAEQYRRALREFPDDLVARNSLAVTLYRAGEWAEALREYEVAVKSNPGDTVARGRVAELYGRLGDATGAAKAYIALSDLFFEQRDREKAVDAWRRVLDLFPDSPDALEMISQAAGLAGEKTFQAEVDNRRARLVAELAQSSERTNGETGVKVAGEPEVGQRVEGTTSSMSVPVNADPDQVEDGAQIAEGEVNALPGDADGWGAAHWDELAVLGEARRAAVIGGLRMKEEYLEQGLVLAAEDQCLSLVGLAPECLLVHEELAALYAREKQIDKALQRYNSLALLYEVRGDLRRAAAMYQSVAGLQPQDLTLRSRVASILLRAGMKRDAQEEFLKVAESYLAQGLVEDTLEAYDQAIAADSENAVVHARLGHVLETLGRHEEAAGCFRRALELEPTDTGSAAGLSVQLGALGDWDGVEDVLATVTDAVAQDQEALRAVVSYYQEAAARLTGNPNVSYCAGVLLRLGGWRDQARDHLRVAADGDGRRSVLCHLYLGEDALLSNDLEAAAGHLREGLRLLASGCEWSGPTVRADVELKCYRLLAETSVARQEWAEAKTALRGIKELAPGDESTHARLAEIHFRLGEVASAVQEFGELAHLCLEAGEADKAVAVCHAALQLDPGDTRLRKQLADSYLRLGAVDEALTQMEEVANRQLESGLEEEGYETLRQMLEQSRSRNAQLALSLRERMARLRPDDVAVRHELVEAYLKAGRPSQALDEARDLADSLLKAGLVGEAVSALRRVNTLNPWDTRVLGQLGDALCMLGEDREAERVYERLLAIEPDNNMAKGALAAIRQRR